MRTLRLFLLLLLPSTCFAQNWSGIIDSSRAIDWTTAGVMGGIPSASWTQCGATIAAGASAATIQTRLNGCAANTFVLLGPGAFTLSTGLSIPSNVVLRGNGANSTKLTFTGSGGYYWSSTLIGFAGSYDTASDNAAAPGFGGCAGTCVKRNWTGTNGVAGTYTKGATVLNLASAPTGLSAGMMLQLVQNDDSGPASGLGLAICSEPSGCSIEGSGYTRQTAQRQNVKVVSVAGSAVTITPGIFMDNWRTSQSPIAYFQACCEVRNAGIENFAVLTNGLAMCEPISFFQAMNSWASGIAITPSSGDRTAFTTRNAMNITIQNSWIGTMNGGGCSSTTSYGIETVASTGLLLLNNIFDRVESPILHSTGTSFSVDAYNYLNSFSGLETGILMHEVGFLYNLLEGNEVTEIRADVIHGTSAFTTAFRNQSTGVQQTPFQMAATNRFFNSIGNVLGHASMAAYTALAPSTCGTCDRFGANVYRLGYPSDSTSSPSPTGGVVYDSNVLATTMLWGNYDTFNGATRFVNAEVPTTLPKYANAVPASQVLPASFIFNSKPSFFAAAKPWPAIGPDVTGGNISGLAGHAYTTPAHDCFTSFGGVIGNFLASTCYAAAAGPAVSLSPTSLSFGSQNIGTTSAALTTTLTNSGTATLNITSITLTGTNPGDFSIFSNTCGASLGVGANCIVGIKFTPALAGGRGANLTFTTNAVSSPDNVPLSGTGTGAPVASFVPTSIAFGNVKVGFSGGPTAVTLTNIGNSTMNITSITITGTDANSFSRTTTCGATLGVNASCAINATFTPGSAGAKSASVSVVSNTASGTDTVPLTGTGTVPIVSLSSGSVNFFNQLVGTTSSIQQVVTLTNSGTATLVITSNALTGMTDFSFTTTCGASLGAGSNCNYSFTFAPTLIGSRSALLTITDDAAGSPHTITLAGTGVKIFSGQGSITGPGVFKVNP